MVQESVSRSDEQIPRGARDDRLLTEHESWKFRCAQDDRPAPENTPAARRPLPMRFGVRGLQGVDEEEVGRGPQRGGDGALRTASDDDFEDFVIGGEVVEECAADGGVFGFQHGELA